MTKRRYHPEATTVADNISEFQSFKKQPRQIIITPKSLKQEEYIDLLMDDSLPIIFATGPAGTGKTMLAVLAALKAFRNGKCKKIVITRPAVGVDDEQHGFLPGDLNAKMAPWTRPIMDVVAEYYRPTDINKMLEYGEIEISPLAYMRGRSLKDAFIICDEMQNATINQMKMVLTRLGDNSKMVITGDLRQTDRHDIDNGLLDFQRIYDNYKKCKYVGGIKFDGKDIHRHVAVSEILKMYGEI